MRNEELREQGSSRIDDQGIVFEGDRGVTPVDEALRQYRLRSANPDRHISGSDSSSRIGDEGGPTINIGPPRNVGRDDSRPPHPREHSGVPDLDPLGPQTRDIRQTESPNRHIPEVEVTRRTPHRYTMPRDLETPARTPGVAEAHKNYRGLMHDRLSGVIDDAVGVAVKLPDGVKPRKMDTKHITAYAGSSKFSELENWVMDVCDHLAACKYGGDHMDRERVLVLPEFLKDEASNWFRRYVRHSNRAQRHWTFKEVVIGLYDRFVNPSTMQDARSAFLSASYSEKLGIQGFYDTLIDHAQNMAVFPDGYTILEMFLDGIPADMRRHLIRQDKLTPEMNSVEEFLVHAIAHEQSLKTSNHYDQRSTRRNPSKKPTPTSPTPAIIHSFRARRSDMAHNRDPRYVIRKSRDSDRKTPP
ncbi:hypothetical protein H0H93_012945, partial [Arthromyces matolae]